MSMQVRVSKSEKIIIWVGQVEDFSVGLHADSDHVRADPRITTIRLL